MGQMKISTGPRYQKTGSPSQKKARRIAETMALVMNDALLSARKKFQAQATTEHAPPREA